MAERSGELCISEWNGLWDLVFNHPIARWLDHPIRLLALQQDGSSAGATIAIR